MTPEQALKVLAEAAALAPVPKANHLAAEKAVLLLESFIQKANNEK